MRRYVYDEGNFLHFIIEGWAFGLTILRDISYVCICKICIYEFDLGLRGNILPNGTMISV